MPFGLLFVFGIVCSHPGRQQQWSNQGGQRPHSASPTASHGHKVHRDDASKVMTKLHTTMAGGEAMAHFCFCIYLRVSLKGFCLLVRPTCVSSAKVEGWRDGGMPFPFLYIAVYSSRVFVFFVASAPSMVKRFVYCCLLLCQGVWKDKE